jgi:predicted nucleic-acid-binding protein
MTAVDTNILVRLLTTDHPSQASAARTLFESGPIWIGKTVLLETAWVLRSVYEFDDETIASTLLRVVALPNVSVEDQPAVVEALDLTITGLEFADALHFASRPEGAVFRTFDQKFLRRAKQAGVKNISLVSA